MLSTYFDSQNPASLAASLILLPVLYIVYSRLLRQPTIWETLPWPGLKEGYLGRLRTAFDPSSRKDLLYKAIQEYSSNDRPFIWQQFLGRPMIILPPSSLRWLIDQPHSTVDAHAFFNDSLALETSLMDPKVHSDPVHVKVIQQNLNRSLVWTPNLIFDELSRCFNEYWGFSPDWHEEVVWPSIIKFVARTVNRMFIGEELCRNDDFLDAAVEYAQIFVSQGLKLRMLPNWMRTVVSYPMTLPQRRIMKRVTAHLGPIIDKRKADYERRLADSSFSFEERNDLLQWLIQHSYQSPDTSNRSTDRIIKRFMSVNFAAIHTTTSNSTNLVLDLAAAEPSLDALRRIREQIATVYTECRGVWTKAHLAKLNLLDSALRETLRASGGGGVWTPSRKVMAPGGLTLPSGLHVPEGAHVAIPSYAAHNPDPSWFEYQPFRWSGLRAGKGEAVLEERNLQATATGVDYLPFGHGKDSCPGRFFAVQEIKLMMVHLLLNYEVKQLGQRTGQMWFSDMPRAPTQAKIEVRKISPPLLD